MKTNNMKTNTYADRYWLQKATKGTAEYFEYEYPEESLFTSPDERFCQCSTNALLIKHK